MTENTVYTVTFGDRTYGVAYHDNKIGVCANGIGRIKYMPVVFNYNFHNFPKLCKTRLPLSRAASDLVDTLVTCSKINCSALECVILCEHILKNGRTPR